VLANTENSSAEEIKEQCSELQQKSLKLFEMAYKKVRLVFRANSNFQDKDTTMMNLHTVVSVLDELLFLLSRWRPKEMTVPNNKLKNQSKKRNKVKTRR
jgi:hypothetical protein